MTENWNNKSTLIPPVSLKIYIPIHDSQTHFQPHHTALGSLCTNTTSQSPLGHSPPLYRDTVTMTTSHLFFSSATQAQTGEVGRRKGGANTPIYTLTHRQAWSGNLSLMLMQRDWYTENLLIFLLFLFLTWLSGTGV